MTNLLQEIAQTGSYISGTFLIDGVLLITGFKLVEESIKAIVRSRDKRNGRKSPRPGEADICRQHGETLSGLMEFKKNAENSLQRIESKVDRLLERK